MELMGRIVETALAKAIERISKKVEKGKKLTDTEVVILLLDGLYKLLNSTGRELAAKVDLTNKRIDDVNKRIDKMDERIEGLRRELVAKVEEEARRLMEYLDVRLSEAEKRARERDLRLARAFT
ncbi:MAG: hypothetical protein DRN99_08015, partial [Thermoproteota archaeon]